MKRVVEAGVLAGVGAVLAGVGGEHFLVTAAEQHEIRVGAAQGGQPRRFAFQQRAYFQQVVERARLRVEQVHQRAGVVVAGQFGDERATALGSLDDAASTQYAQALAQRGAGNAQLLAQAAFRWQRLADLQYTVDDQPFDTLGDDIGDLTTVIVVFVMHVRFSTGRTSWAAV